MKNVKISAVVKTIDSSGVLEMIVPEFQREFAVWSPTLIRTVDCTGRSE
jgi:hypothetical protein